MSTGKTAGLVDPLPEIEDRRIAAETAVAVAGRLQQCAQNAIKN